MNKYKESKFFNGLTFITSKNRNSEVVSVSFVIKAGSRYEQSGQYGYAHLLEHMLLQGTESKPSAFEINRIIDRSGALFNVFTDVEVIRLSAIVAKDHLEKILELMIEMVTEPIISKKVLENEKKVVIQELKRMLDNKVSRLWIESVKRVFIGHPLSHYPIGEENDIIEATIEELKDYYDRFFVMSRMAIVVVGDIEHDELANFIEKRIGEGKSKKREIDNIAFPLSPQKGKVFIQMSGTQTYLAFNFPIQRYSFKESAIFDIIVNYLGYHHTSLLYQEIRHKLGLVYSISILNLFFRDAALIHITTSTTFPDKVVELILDRVSRIKEHLDKNTFCEYQQQVINIQKRKLAGAFEEMLFLLRNWNLYNRLVTPKETREAIEEVNYQELIETARKYLNKDNLLIVALGAKDCFGNQFR